MSYVEERKRLKATSAAIKVTGRGAGQRRVKACEHTRAPQAQGQGCGVWSMVGSTGVLSPVEGRLGLCMTACCASGVDVRETSF